MEKEDSLPVTDIVCLVDTEINVEEPIPAFFYDRENGALKEFDTSPINLHRSCQIFERLPLFPESIIQQKKEVLKSSIAQLTEKTRKVVLNCIKGNVRGSVLLDSPGGSALTAGTITSLIKHVVSSGGQFRGYGTEDIASAAANILVTIPNPGDRVLLPDSSLFFHSGSNISEAKQTGNVDPEILEAERDNKEDFLNLLADGPDATINARVSAVIDEAFSDPRNIDNHFSFTGEEAAKLALARCLESSEALQTDFLNFHQMESFPKIPFCSGLDDFFRTKSERALWVGLNQALKELGIELK